MPIANDLASVAALIGQAMEVPPQVVLLLPQATGAPPANLLWPWRIEDMVSQAPAPPGAGGGLPRPSRTISLHALLLASSFAEFDAARRAIHAHPVIGGDRGRLHLLTEALASDALCALFQAARSPLQLALPLIVRDAEQ